MGKLLNEEVSESKKPLILIYTNNKILQDLFFDEFSEKLSLLYVSDASPSNDTPETFHIKTSDINLLPHLEEKINYAIVIFNGDSSKSHVEYLVKKITADSSKAVFLFPAEHYKSYLDIALQIKPEKNIIPALYGNILEDESSDSPFLKIIRMALATEKIRLTGNDLQPVFPISRSDLMICIKQLLFSHKPHALYYLFYKKPQTLLSAIHFLAQIEPELEFEINHESVIERFEERSVMDQNISDKLNLKISYLDHHMKGFLYSVESLKFKKVKAYEKPKSISRKKLNFSTLKFLKFSPSLPLALSLSLLAFVLINLIFGIIGIIFLKSSIHAFENNDFKSAKEKGIVAKNALSVPIPTLRIIESSISQIPFLEGSYKTLSLVTSTADLGAIASEIILKLDDVNKGISKNDFENIIMNTQYLYHSGERTLLNQENRAISNLLKPEISKSISLISVIPDLMGYTKKQEYLLLFMNNSEIRPTGGFIGSVGRLIVQNGKVSDFSIQDVYELDGQLKKHVEPHYIIRRYLQPHLYLRDSNFDLDFQRSASVSAMLYQLESGNKPDGVVAVDFTLVEEILKITGPVNLSTYNETITSENSMQFLQETIEDGNFPGSTQKKEILNELFSAITLKLEKNPEHLVSIGLKLPQLLERKHILLSYQNENIQSLLSALNFGGQIPSIQNSSDDTIYDTIGINEANIGVNKVNKNISRSIYYEADLSKRISRTKVSIRNESQKDKYTSYLRIIAPRNSVLRKITIDGKEAEITNAITDYRIYEADNFTLPNALEVSTDNDYLKTIFGTVINVDKNKIMNIEFEYTNPLLFLDDGKDAYSLAVIKQPGTYITPSSFNIKYPEGYSASGTDIASYGEGVVKLENNLNTDLNYEIKFAKE